MYTCEIRNIGPVNKNTISQAIIPSKGLIAIALGPQCLIDVVTLAQDGNMSPKDTITLGVGCPWLGELTCSSLALVGAPSGPINPSFLIQERHYGIPVAAVPANTIWNGRNVQGMTDLPVEIALYYGAPPPIIPIRRAPFCGYNQLAGNGTYVFPVFGRHRISVSLECTGGTSIDYEIRGLDRTLNGEFAGTAIAALASGTLTNATATDEFMWGYDGPPYEWIQIVLSNAAGGGVADIYVHGYDL